MLEEIKQTIEANKPFLSIMKDLALITGPIIGVIIGGSITYLAEESQGN